VSSVNCRWCGKRRGVVYLDTPNRGPYGILVCPRCDWAHAAAAGPPASLAHRIRDVDPKP
jgi:hypothetical protein